MLDYFKRSKECGGPFLGPTLSILKLWIIDKKFAFFYRSTMFTLMLGFNVTNYIELWIIRKSHKMAMRNLCMSLLDTTIVTKLLSYVICHKSWLNLAQHVNTLEQQQLSQNDATTKMAIAQYSKKSRWAHNFYHVLMLATLSSTMTGPIFKYYFFESYKEMNKNGSILYPEMSSSWVPFEKSTVLGYAVVTVEQSIACLIAAATIRIFDCNFIVLMCFFEGQFKLLSLKCEQLFGDGKLVVTYDEAMKRIKECHYHHLYLVKYCAVLNSLISPVMFVHIILFSLMIGSKCIELSMEVTGNRWHIWTLEHVFSIVVQFFVYCWFSNEVLYASNKVDIGVYSSAWWSQNVRMRRCVLLLSGQLRKSIVFTAGPFTNINMETFLTIMKGSYSYYTLLSQKKK